MMDYDELVKTLRTHIGNIPLYQKERFANRLLIEATKALETLLAERKSGPLYVGTVAGLSEGLLVIHNAVDFRGLLASESCEAHIQQVADGIRAHVVNTLRKAVEGEQL